MKTSTKETLQRSLWKRLNIKSSFRTVRMKNIRISCDKIENLKLLQQIKNNLRFFEKRNR